jgi:hypothetical protein
MEPDHYQGDNSRDRRDKVPVASPSRAHDSSLQIPMALIATVCTEIDIDQAVIGCVG